jgi:hypothetical protein
MYSNFEENYYHCRNWHTGTNYVVRPQSKLAAKGLKQLESPAFCTLAKWHDSSGFGGGGGWGEHHGDRYVSMYSQQH